MGGNLADGIIREAWYIDAVKYIPGRELRENEKEEKNNNFLYSSFYFMQDYIISQV